LVVIFISFLAVVCLPRISAQSPIQPTARDYYKELYDAGGLDRMGAEYACFKDDPQHDTFFIFGQSRTLRERMIAAGTFNPSHKVPKDAPKEDFLIVRGYQKGIPWAEDMFFTKQGGLWTSEKMQTMPLGNGLRTTIIIVINWQTLRYRWGVEVVDKGQRHAAGGHFGRCEKIPIDVRQNAEPN
jgi:hypothetical protein